MGLFKRCTHWGRNRDRCDHQWWGSFQHDGKLFRVSLGKWANEDVKTKQQAQAIYDRFRQAVRADRVSSAEDRRHDPVTFDQLADVYVERYVTHRALRTADTIDYRLKPLRNFFGRKALTDIGTSDVEDFIADLRKTRTVNRQPDRALSPASINRSLALLRHMLNWAVGRGYIERSPFRRGSQTLIRLFREDNKRRRRISEDEEQRTPSRRSSKRPVASSLARLSHPLHNLVRTRKRRRRIRLFLPTITISSATSREVVGPPGIEPGTP